MFRAQSQRWNRSQNPRQRQFFLSACLIAKNEVAYILEWIAYHRVVGFDFFYIYDNDSNDRISDILSPLAAKGICCVIDWPRSSSPDNPQVSAYHHNLVHFGDETEWLATIDADEFVVPLTSNNVASILADSFQNRDAVLCNWRIFGSAGHREPNGQLCMERFHRASRPDFSANNNVKSIFRPKTIESIFVHNHYMRSDNIALSDNSDFAAPREQITASPVYGHMQINHYFCKSQAEFFIKRLKGLADHPIEAPYAMRAFQMFADHDRNECLEQTIFKFLYETKNELSRLKSLL